MPHKWGLPQRVHDEDTTDVQIERVCENGCGVGRLSVLPTAGTPYLLYWHLEDDDMGIGETEPPCAARPVRNL